MLMNNNAAEQHAQSSFGGYPHNGGGNAVTRGGPSSPASINPIGLDGIKPPTNPSQGVSFAPMRFAPRGSIAPSAAAKPAGPLQQPVQLGAPVQPRPTQPISQPPNQLTSSPLERGGGFGGPRPLMQY